MVDLTGDFCETALTKVCEFLQLTDTQYGAAERAYRAVGLWLGEGGPLAALDPRIFPQGSMALGTTVRPRGRVEYDLDMVLEIDGVDVSPAWLYDSVRERLAENNRYRPMLDQLPRCLRLNYAGQFHLDIVPARSHRDFGQPFIEIPEAPSSDGQLHSWVTSNPVGYIRWFEDQCAKSESFRVLLEKARQEPMPRPVLTSEKPVLARAVQLFKRHRDLFFRDAADAPSSIVLTTLTASFYRGQGSVHQTLVDVLDEIIEATRTDPQFRTLENPSTSEKLCVKWTDEQSRRFTTFLTRFRDSLKSLRSLLGLHNIGAVLKELFGEETATGPDIVAKAITEYMREFTETRDRGDLGFTQSGLATVGGMAIKKHSFYGRKIGK